jgi:hypothetical protein
MPNLLTNLVVLAVSIGIIYGWVMNLITLIGGGYELMSQTIVGVIGIIIAPVGAIVYYVAG